MALFGEIHPYAHCIADLWGPGELAADTIPGMQARERALEGCSEETKAIYYAMKAEFHAGKLEPLRREWCIERPGIDPPDVPDFTRHVFDIDQVLSLIRRRGDTGRLIDALISCYSEGRAPLVTSGSQFRRERGPRPQKRMAVEAAMKMNIEAGTLNRDDLSQSTEEALAAEYHVSRYTVRNARNNVLSEVSAAELRQTPTNDK
jgi:hypothetical protein